MASFFGFLLGPFSKCEMRSAPRSICTHFNDKRRGTNKGHHCYAVERHFRISGCLELVVVLAEVNGLAGIVAGSQNPRPDPTRTTTRQDTNVVVQWCSRPCHSCTSSGPRQDCSVTFPPPRPEKGRQSRQPACLGLLSKSTLLRQKPDLVTTNSGWSPARLVWGDGLGGRYAVHPLR